MSQYISVAHCSHLVLMEDIHKCNRIPVIFENIKYLKALNVLHYKNEIYYHLKTRNIKVTYGGFVVIVVIIAVCYICAGCWACNKCLSPAGCWARCRYVAHTLMHTPNIHVFRERQLYFIVVINHKGNTSNKQ